MNQLSTGTGVQAVLDRIEVEDAIYRYASCIDRHDLEGVRATLADDVWARYGDAEPLIGGDEVVRFIAEYTEDCVWGHHLLSVDHVDVEGDTAKALVYHTSHQLYHGTPDTVHKVVAPYHDELRRVQTVGGSADSCSSSSGPSGAPTRPTSLPRPVVVGRDGHRPSQLETEGEVTTRTTAAGLRRSRTDAGRIGSSQVGGPATSIVN